MPVPVSHTGCGHQHSGSRWVWVGPTGQSHSLVWFGVCRERWELLLHQQWGWKKHQAPGWVSFSLSWKHRIAEYSELEGTHRFQLLALLKTSPSRFSSGFCLPRGLGAAASHQIPGLCLLLSLGRCGCQPSVQCAFLLRHLVTPSGFANRAIVWYFPVPKTTFIAENI